MMCSVILVMMKKIKKNVDNDYGQCWDRQSLRKDFNPELTKSKVFTL